MWAVAFSFLRFLDHTQWHTTVGRTPLDEWSVHRRDLYLTTCNTRNRQTSMPPPVGLEPTISAGERPQTYALDCTATRMYNITIQIICCQGKEKWKSWASTVFNSQWWQTWTANTVTCLNITEIRNLCYINVILTFRWRKLMAFNTSLHTAAICCSFMTVSVTTSVSGPPSSSSIITCKGKQFALSSWLWLCLYVNDVFWHVCILTFTTFENQL